MNNHEIIIAYVTSHPGCGLAELLRMTDITKPSLTSALCKMTQKRKLQRRTKGRHFVYYARHSGQINLDEPK